MKLAKFNPEQVIIIRMIDEGGEQDAASLAWHLGIDRGRLNSLLHSLARKRIVRLHRTGYGTMVRLSEKGQRAAVTLWPQFPAVSYKR